MRAEAESRGDTRKPDPRRAPYDSITVTRLAFPGLASVDRDDIRRGLFTRASTCRLPFLIPACRVTATQLFTDRRRTTSKALGEDITKIQVALWQRGYRNARVDTAVVPSRNGRGHEVSFLIHEGQPVRVAGVDLQLPVGLLASKQLETIVTVRQGDPLSLVALDTTLARLRAAVWNLGYGDARIDTAVPRPDAAGLVPVRITVDPRHITRVGSVQFEGNRYLDSATLARGLMLTPGALYTRDAVLETQRRLFEHPGLARAVVVTPPSGDSIKRITVAITEVPARRLELTGGFNTVEFGQAAAELRHHDLGNGRWLRLHAAAANLGASQLDGVFPFRRAVPSDADFDGAPYLRPTYQASVTLTQPWLGSARTNAALSAFAGRRSLTGVAIDENAGVSLGIVRHLAPRLPVGLHYRFETTRVSATAVYFCAGYGICDAGTLTALGARQRLSPVGASAWIDRSDDLENPTMGYTAVADLEHASRATASTFGHSRVNIDGSYYRTIGTRPRDEARSPKVLAFHGRLGAVKPVGSAADPSTVTSGLLHPRARFYAGGMQSVRGFAENELGPRVLQARRASLLAAGCTTATIADATCDPTAVPGNELFARPVGGSTVVEGSVEMRLPILKLLGAVAFLDGARVGTEGITSIAKARSAITPGVGFRYRSPLGVLRLDFGLRPVGRETLPVVVAISDVDGNERIVRLRQETRWSLVDPSPGLLRSVGRRIVVHFAMGQAF